MKAEIDCYETGRGKPFPHFWESTGFSPAKLLLRSDMEQQLDMLGAVRQHGIRYIRVHFLLDLVVVKRDRWGVLQGFDWTTLDEALGRMVRNGLRPIFELMGNPSGEYNHFNTPQALSAWRDLIQALAVHLEEEADFGQAEVRHWLFETWNEPDIPNGWFPGDAEAFCRYYDACAAGLWAVDEKLVLGGPGTCRTLSNLFTRFLAHCDRGTSCMEEGKSVRIDFISVHEKGAKAHAEDLTPNSTRIVERESWAMRYIAEHHGSKLGRLPFFNDECDPQVGWWDTHTWRAKAYYPALAAKIIDQHDRWFVESFDPKRILESGVMPYGLLSNDNGFLGCWGQRTLLARFTDTGTEDAGQTGCKNAGGRFDPCLGSVPCELIKLPILNLMSLLAMLGNQRLHLETDDRGSAGSVGVLATRRGQQISVLVYASDDQIQRSGEREVSLRFNGVNLAEHQLLHYALDDTQEEGNPFQVWERLGAPEAANGELTVDMLHAMQDVQELRLAGDIDGSRIDPAGYTFTLNIPSVHLILLTPRHAPAASAPEILWSKVYPGLDGRINRMLRWQTLHEEWVRFYRVLGSNKMDGTFVPLNSDKTVLVDNGFVHRDVRQTPYFYRVEAYGYGNQPPAVSHVHVAG